jgi:hypothetical protein
MMYRTLRTIHLLCGVFALPMLLMYGMSAVQMAHSKWFDMKPSLTEVTLPMPSNYTDGRQLAHDIMANRGIRGEITAVEQTPAGFNVRIVVPGIVHEIRYDRATRTAVIRRSAAGFMGMINRLHHAAGFWHDYLPMKWWALLVGVVSLATIGLATTGIWMWWIRKQERKLGVILLAANLLFSVIVLALIRSAGP